MQQANRKGVLGWDLPEVNDHLLHLVHIQGEAHFLPLICLIIVADEIQSSCVIRKLDEVVGAVCWKEVVSQQGE